MRIRLSSNQKISHESSKIYIEALNSGFKEKFTYLEPKKIKPNNNNNDNKIIRTATLLRMARILRRFLETCGDLLSLKLEWKTIS